MSDLETRVAKLEAAEEIKRLKARHVQLTDQGGYPAEELSKLWADDAAWEGITTDVPERWAPDIEGLGAFRGLEEITRFWGLNGDVYRWVHHIMGAPDITVNDDLVTAKGKWHFLMPSIREIEGKPSSAWIGGFHNDQYKLVDGVWKFYRVQVHICLMADHAEGWYPDRYLAEPPV